MATMSQWQADTAEDVDFGLSDFEGDEIELRELMYQYYVHRREWLTN